MCNLYSITTNQAAIIALFRVVNRYVGKLPPMPGVFLIRTEKLPRITIAHSAAADQARDQRLAQSRLGKRVRHEPFAAIRRQTTPLAAASGAVNGAELKLGH
jgi:hypothetical protein